jgi:hypothetical protein
MKKMGESMPKSEGNPTVKKLGKYPVKGGFFTKKDVKGQC